MKREIIFSTYDSLGNPFYSGGGAVAIHSVAKRLVTNYRVSILTAKFKDAEDCLVDGVHYQYIGTSILGPKIGQLLFQLILPFYVISKKFDYWIESFTPPFSTACLQLFTRKPVIGLVHMLSAEDMNRKYKLPFQLIENVGLRTYHNFIVLSQNIKNQIEKQNKKALITVIPNGVDLPQKLTPYSKRDKKYILFIGRIEINQKGVDKLILAYKKISANNDFSLKIAGDGTLREISTLKKLINFHNLQSKIELLGRVGGPEKEKVLSHASIVVIPSRFETFSLTALESLAYGIPLVIFDIKGMAWIPKGLSIKANPFSENSLAQKIDLLLKNPSLRSNISKRQILESLKFSWEDVAARYEENINQLVS